MRNGSWSMRRALVVVAVFGIARRLVLQAGQCPDRRYPDPPGGTGDGDTFAPSTVTVNRGQLITVDNVGQVPHTFTVTGHGIDVETQSGKTSQITIDLPPGTYPFICRFHIALGMKGTLVVR